MSRPRDSQRSKVWDSILAVFGQTKEHRTMQECQEYIERVYLKESWLRQPSCIDFADGRGCRYANARWEDPMQRDALITLPRDDRAAWDLLMMVAYLQTRPEDPWHGWYFCQTYLKLVKRFLGEREYVLLRREFKIRKVRYKEPRKREMTGEQREAARQRMQRLHLKRELESGEWNLGTRVERMLDES